MVTGEQRAVPAGPRRLQPVVLRTPPPPDQTGRPSRRQRSRVDMCLIAAEWLVAALLVALVGYRIVDGAVYDWLYVSSTPPAPAAQPVVQSPVADAGIRQPSPAAEADDLEMRYPELGRALPSIRPGGAAPRFTPDYLVPARSFVPAEVAAQPVQAQQIVEPADLLPVHIRAPRVRLDAPVKEVFLENGVWQVADYAAGYLHGTGTPAEGNVVLAGHKGVRGSVFARLEKLKFGDEVFVDAGGHRFRYRVRETGRVWPSQVRILYPTATPTLTLLTCTNWDMQRFVVVADLVDAVELAAASG